MKHTPSPLCFTEVLGQGKARDLVLRTMSSGRVPHAYIFKGPDGVGKRLFGRGLAAAMSCRGERAGRACGECSSCRKFISGNHPDFMVVQPDKGMIKIGQVREMCRALTYPPYESENRFVLLEDVHTMRQEAANSLLKTLEEPPPGNVLILTAEASRDVLTTISSRCQVIPFYGLSEADCSQVIRLHVSDIDEENASVLSRLAEGSPGRAILLHEHAMIPMLTKVAGALADPAFDGNNGIGMLLKLADEMAGLKEQLVPFLGLLRLWLRDVLFAAEEQGHAHRLNGIGVAAGKSLKHWSSEHLFAKLQAIDKAEKQLKRNCNRSLVCEVLLFELH